MASAFHGHESDVHAGLFQGAKKAVALVEGDSAVFVAVHDEEWGRVF